jgi:glycosyltransferase involved in cell wall biosynthesis
MFHSQPGSADAAGLSPDRQRSLRTSAASPLRILVATDAWRPQVNGVVRTLEALADNAPRHGAEITMLTPAPFRTVPMPGYREIRLALPDSRLVARTIEAARPHAIHIATEGPVGLQVLRYCQAHRIPFTTCYHTRYPEYLSARLPVPLSLSYAYLRRFHNAGAATMVATQGLQRELQGHGFTRLVQWKRGVDLSVFASGRTGALRLPRPISLCVARLAVEKNIDAFLKLDLPGTKVVVGDGPARRDLERAYPEAVFLGLKSGRELADIYASSDVFVFPSRTDTYGLVLIEALAAGLPVAAFPVAGPRDILAGSGCGAMAEDLRMAVFAALAIRREACKAFAERHGLDDSTRSFIGNVRTALLKAIA